MKKILFSLILGYILLAITSCSKTVTKTVTVTDTVTVTRNDTIIQTKIDSNVNLTNGLLAYYPFNGNANDVSGNNLNGTIYGGVTFTNDVSGNANSAVTFDGATGYIIVPDPTSIFQTNSVSISFLTNISNASVRNSFVANVNFLDGSGVDYAVQITLAGINKFQFAVISNTNGCASPVYDASADISAANDITLNKWYSVVAVFSDS